MKRKIDKVIPAEDINNTLDHYIQDLGFKLEYIFPADTPRGAIVFNDEERIQIGEAIPPSTVVPEGTQEFIHTKMDTDVWNEGRAGMSYRDLIPGRLGGRFIASHIRIPEGGPVPDYVHFHNVRFQMIYIYKGWVKVVYEDQGPPFIMKAGDCILQPPEIRHRVLESSDQFEVIEISCPAEHMTYAEHEIELPTSVFQPDRNFNGQTFVNHRASEAEWAPRAIDGYECRDIGISSATKGLAGAKVVRSIGKEDGSMVHNGEFYFLFILQGSVTLITDTDRHIETGGSIVIPAGMEFQLRDLSKDTEFLEVTLPGDDQ